MSYLLDILKKSKEEVQEGIKEQYKLRLNASSESRGGIENRLIHLKAELKRLNKEIEEEKNKYKSPSEAKAYLYIIVTTKSNVKTNINNDCFCLIEENRYHDNDLKKWRPFSDSKTISEIIDEFKSSYRLSEYYIDHDSNNEHTLKIQDNEANTIGIIDLLSINNNNSAFIKHCFDRNSIAGLILPQCRNISKHDSIFKFIKSKREDIFGVFHKRISIGASCSNYLFDMSEYDNFRRRLKALLKTTCQIRNQSNINSPIRDSLQNSFQ